MQFRMREDTATGADAQAPLGLNTGYMTADDVKAKIIEILNDMPSTKDGLFQDDSAQQIRKVMNGASPWRELKENGLKALGKGQNQIAAVKLLGKLRDHGILVPPVGEMESFYPFSASHGMTWVNEVLCLDLVNDEILSEARKFAEVIVSART